ncbi:MAG: hypothetical protein MUE44_05445 [Oscillatoriaceae cyanobacterium Prado104]|jgi:hypothetical protein|nr:hypothetical protein [Oscillatoriaceae cyanobacterium Prado104]
MKIQISLAPAAVTQFLLRTVACLVGLSLLSQMAVYLLPDYPFRDFLARAFSLDAEQNVPTVYSVLTLLFSSILLGAIAHAKNLDSSRYGHHWRILSFIFLYLSVDEGGQLHELLVYPTQKLLNATGFLYFSWVIPFGLMVAIFLASYTKFLFHLPVATRNLFVAASVLYIGGALGMEMLGGNEAYQVGRHTIAYLIMATFEESCEMLGIIVFIHALMCYIKTHLGGLNWDISLGTNRQLAESQNIPLATVGEPTNSNIRS